MAATEPETELVPYPHLAVDGAVESNVERRGLSAVKVVTPARHLLAPLSPLAEERPIVLGDPQPALDTAPL